MRIDRRSRVLVANQFDLLRPVSFNIKIKKDFKSVGLFRVMARIDAA
jgi:hypothetical protein